MSSEAEDWPAQAAEEIAMKAEALGMARATLHSYGDCLAGLTLLAAAIGDQAKRDAVARMCVEGARLNDRSFSGTVRRLVTDLTRLGAI